MLYPRQPFQQEGTEEFILSAIPKNDDIDISKIAAIEQKLHSGVTQEEAELFLDFMAYNSRIALNYNNSINVLDYSFYGQCAYMANLNRTLLEKLNLPYSQFNVGDVVCDNKESMHALIMVSLPIIKDNKVEIKNFLLDPSFRQFFIKKDCDFSAYNSEKKGNIRKAAPSAGYFFNLSDKGKDLAESIIYNGYMEMTPENIKCYFDSFKLSTLEKEDYSTEEQVGKCYQTDNSASDYFDLIKSTKFYPIPVPEQYISYTLTATEIINKQNSRFISKMKNFFSKHNSSDDFNNSGYHR